MVTYYNEKDLVSFGNYLLSDERKQCKINSRDEMIRQGMKNPLPLEDMMKMVTHADVENWKFEESLRKSKNFLKTLGVDMDKVLFATAPNLYLRDDNGQMTLDPGDNEDGAFRFVETGHYKSIQASYLKDLCDEADWCIFYLTDQSKLMTNEMGIIVALRAAFITRRPLEARNEMRSRVDGRILTPEDLETNKSAIQNALQVFDAYRYATIAGSMRLDTQAVVDVIQQACEQNGWIWDASAGYALEDMIGGSAKVRFKIRLVPSAGGE